MPRVSRITPKPRKEGVIVAGIRKVRKEKKKEVQWARHPEWTLELVAILLEDSTIQDELFHDSKNKANPPIHGKAYYYGKLADRIFQERVEDYDKGSVQKEYAESLGNYLNRYVVLLSHNIEVLLINIYGTNLMNTLD